VVKNANPVSVLKWVSLVALSAALMHGVAGCGGDTSALAVATPKSVAEFFEIRVADTPVRMQIAVRDDEMKRGLMERRDLGPSDGMLFVYARPQQMSFWMRNTPTPLDIGFFDASGKLVEIYPLHPFDETGVRSRSDDLLFALEMNQGWFRNNGIRPGALLDLKAVAEALKARGFQPEKFGILP
jgi:uncharacterized membrane protein (UPF0127 family)